MLTTLLSLFTAGSLLIPNFSDPPINNWQSSSLLEVSSLPKVKENNIGPVIKAKSAIAVDLKTGLALYEKNIHDQRSIASITKLMTVVIILEENKMDDVVTVPQKITTVQGTKIWLAPGEKITVENLLYAALIPSANDAAYTLANYNSNGNIDEFIKKMNQKALELGLYDTHFTNPIGLDDEGNYSSAYDLTLLGRYAYSKAFVRQATVLKDREISSTNGRLVHKLKTTNDLLNSYLKVLGLKTGTTDQAGECLIAVIENDKGRDILTVTLGSPDRYKETKILADWVFRSYNWY
ncbi:MAG: D-alanyl-D-alanine carboxypeptidase family protein [Candidatus Gracilibacteria bacterium]|jgi:D-alanyl-D-alanine carboxypeptidase